MAKEFRNKIKLINNFDNSFISELNEKEDKIMLKYLVKITNKNKQISFLAINYDKKKFLNFFDNLNLNKNYKSQLFHNYIEEQLKYYNKLVILEESVTDKIKEIMYKHFINHMDNRKKFYLFKKL